MSDNEKESGWKWWARYVIVPLVGGGGVLSVIVALIATKTVGTEDKKSMAPASISSPSSTPGPATSSRFLPEEKAETVDFFVIKKGVRLDGKEFRIGSMDFPIGGGMSIFWRVKNTRGHLFLRQETFDETPTTQSISDSGMKSIRYGAGTNLYIEEQTEGGYRRIGELHIKTPAL